MKHYYCSLFSREYAYKGVLLYNSLLQHDKDFHFFIVCMDEEAKLLFENMNMERATLISIFDIEKSDPELLEVKDTRNDKEYCWTAKGSILLYILIRFLDIDHIVHVDGDTCFYSDPKPIFDEWSSHSIMLTGERWREGQKNYTEKYGKYNAGFMGFKRDKEALRCLRYYRQKLIKWCYDKHENGLWSDQLHMNDWAQRFENVIVLKNLGVNINPYIIKGCRVRKHGSDIYINGHKLILYHSYGFKYLNSNEYELCSYGLSFSDDVIRLIYLPYIYACRVTVKRINELLNGFYKEERPNSLVRNYFNIRVNEEQSKDCVHLCTVTSKAYIVQCLALYNSLKETSDKFHLWICPVDDTAYKLLEKMNLENATVINLNCIKTNRLSTIKQERKVHEFCWTVKSVFTRFVVKNNYSLSSIFFIDADLFFFEDIKTITEEWGDKSIFLTKLWLNSYWTGKVGRFSAGLIGFKRDEEGMKCLSWWRRRCLNWCFDIYEEHRWSDQKYLNQFPDMCSSIKITDNWGINAGPWNLRKARSVIKYNSSIYFTGYKLICYHFSGFRVYRDGKMELCNRRRLPKNALPIYSLYVDRINKVLSQIREVDPHFIDNALPSSSSQQLINEPNEFIEYAKNQ